MGIYAHYIAVPPSEIAQAQHDLSLWGTLSFAPPDSYPACNLQRAWSTLWYLLDPKERWQENLKRASNVLGQAVMGAHVFCRHFCMHPEYQREVDTAYNHPRYLTAPEVREAAEALAALSRESFLEAYDPEHMEPNTYRLHAPEIAWSYFCALREFYAGAALRGDAVVVHIW